jgi:hypothetical protein
VPSLRLQFAPSADPCGFEVSVTVPAMKIFSRTERVVLRARTQADMVQWVADAQAVAHAAAAVASLALNPARA